MAFPATRISRPFGSGFAVSKSRRASLSSIDSDFWYPTAFIAVLPVHGSGLLSLQVEVGGGSRRPRQCHHTDRPPRSGPFQRDCTVLGVSISSFDTDFSFRDSVPMATPIRSSFFIKS